MKQEISELRENQNAQVKQDDNLANRSRGMSVILSNTQHRLHEYKQKSAK
jgi:hypothetical protein